MADMASWIQTGIAAAVMSGGSIAYLRLEFRNNREARAKELEGLRTEFDDRLKVMEKEFKGLVDVERGERHREVDRVQKSLDNLQGVPKDIALISQVVGHLGDRFTESRATQERTMGDIHQFLVKIDDKVDALALAQAREQSKTRNARRLANA